MTEQMRWLDFNEFGDLPVGVHRAKITEVISHFGGGTPHRVGVTGRLERIYALARGSSARFIVFGSYVTDEPNPHDVDVFLVMQGGFSAE